MLEFIEQRAWVKYKQVNSINELMDELGNIHVCNLEATVVKLKLDVGECSRIRRDSHFADAKAMLYH